MGEGFPTEKQNSKKLGQPWRPHSLDEIQTKRNFRAFLPKFCRAATLSGLWHSWRIVLELPASACGAAVALKHAPVKEQGKRSTRENWRV